MTEETPAKVLSLLGVALVSMSFMFAVTVSNASFTQVYNPMPDIFAPANVMAVLDNVSNSYSNFVYAQLVRPEAPGYAMAARQFGLYWSREQVRRSASFLGLGAQRVYASGRKWRELPQKLLLANIIRLHREGDWVYSPC